MKAITLVKGQKVNTTDTQDLQNGITAFQIVKFIINYFGTEIETVHDTKIMKDGRQIVIGGCGYINEGYEL